jgi:hypothetical protein
MSESNRDNARRTGPALEQTYRFLLWLIPTVDKFPRKEFRRHNTQLMASRYACFRRQCR